MPVSRNMLASDAELQSTPSSLRRLREADTRLTIGVHGIEDRISILGERISLDLGERSCHYCQWTARAVSVTYNNIQIVNLINIKAGNRTWAIRAAAELIH